MRISCECGFSVKSGKYQGTKLEEGQACPWCQSPLICDSQKVDGEEPTEIVSVVIPFFQGKKWLKQLGETLRSQTYPKVEVVLSGDGEDPEDSIEDEFEGLNYTTIENPKLGISGVTNLGIRHALGEFILHMDQDDLLDPEAIYKLTKFLHNHPEYGAVYANQQIGDEEHPNVSFSRSELLRTNIIGHPILVRRRVMLEALLDSRDDLAQDIGFCLRLSELTQIGKINQVLYKWNLHGDNPSLTKSDEQQTKMREATKAAAVRRMSSPSICFVLPTVTPCGGVRVVLHAAQYLKDIGLDVHISLGRDSCLAQSRLDWEQIDTPFLNTTVPIHHGIPQWCDLAIATGWETLKDVVTHERKGYGGAAWYIQNWEKDWYSTSTQTNHGVYRVAVCSERLGKLVEDEWGIESSLLPSSIDLSQFYPAARGRSCGDQRKTRILIPWRESEYKNPEILKALTRELVKSGREVILLSPHIPSDSEFYQELNGYWKINPSQDAIRGLYQICDFVMTTSLSEGHSVISLEAMACGCIPIVQESGNEFCSETVGVILPNQSPVSSYIDALNELEGFKCGWTQLRKNGIEFVSMFSKENIGKLWESVVIGWSTDYHRKFIT